MAVATKPVRIPRPESGVLKACLDLLGYEKIWHRRQNTGAITLEGKQNEWTRKTKKRFVQFNPAGTPDIMATPALRTYTVTNAYPGTTKPDPIFTVVLWIETKSDIGKQTKEQKEFQVESERHGHRYIVVNDVDQLREELKKYGRVK